MWREQIDIFWDGRRRLALGWFDGAERALAASARPELAVFSAIDEDFAQATLIDLIDAPRWRARTALFDAPEGHRFIGIAAGDGAELRLSLAAEREQPPGGEWRLLMTLLPEAGAAEPAVFKLVALPGRGDIDRLAREQTAAAGPRLVFAIGQRRVVERLESGGALARLGPTRRMFPAHQSRLMLEAAPLEAEAAADTREAPFAILAHWLREGGAPRVILRLRIPDSLEESAALLGRCCVVLAMNQRRRLKSWMMDQRIAGEASVDPLTFDDIRQATGELQEHPDAAEGGDALVVANLLTLILDGEEAEIDGVAIRRAREKNAPGAGETMEIEFYGAALGDDVGIICPTALPGDLGVSPADPGGAPFARLFRVEGDGVIPRRAGDDDGLLDELMRRANDAARVATGAAARAVAERAAGLQNRRDKLVSALNGALTRAEIAGRFDANGLWDVFETLQQTSFVALAADSPPAQRQRLQQLGGASAYRLDPALTAALLRGELAQDPRPLQSARPGGPLLRRYLAACGASGMAQEPIDAMTEARLMRALMQESGLAALRDARIALANDAATRRDAADAARALADADGVERALEYFILHGATEAAAALQTYLAQRRAMAWTPAEEAIELASLVARAGIEREAQEAESALAEPPPPPEKPKGFFRRLFGG